MTFSSSFSDNLGPINRSIAIRIIKVMEKAKIIVAAAEINRIHSMPGLPEKGPSKPAGFIVFHAKNPAGGITY